LSEFLTVVRRLDTVAPGTPAVVDDEAIAGRQQQEFAAVSPKESLKYIKLTPAADWRVSWERRTWPIVSVSGTPSSELCRQLHVETTGCDGWSEGNISQFHELTENILPSGKQNRAVFRETRPD
jgi:hypothetical protein